MKQQELKVGQREKFHPRSRYLKLELSKRLRSIISTFPEVKRKTETNGTAAEIVQKSLL